MGVTCNYCGKPAKLIPAVKLYGAEAATSHYAHKRFWRCDPCDAHVGTHGMSEVPLGTLANAELRKIRTRAHRHFDRKWKGRGKGVRKKCYAWLVRQLGIPARECHIGSMDARMCQRVIDLCPIPEQPTKGFRAFQ